MDFKKLDIDDVDWVYLDSFPDRTIFQTRAWLRFVAATQRAEPVLAELLENGEPVGFFTGWMFRKYGARILGSPFPGSTTAYVGFNLLPRFPRAKALAGLVDFAFSDLACVHVEVMDRLSAPEDGIDFGFDYSKFCTYELDLTKDEDQLFAEMDGSCRTSVRKAAKCGVTIEEAHDIAFADEYYAQLQDVFARQRLIPTYPKARVRALLEHLLPTGNLLLLRARDSQGKCIATAIFAAWNNMSYYWGGASWHSSHKLRPNEPLQWYAMRYWKERGITHYDLGGGGRYKEKYGCTPIYLPWFRKSKYPLLSTCRDNMKKVTKMVQRTKGTCHWLAAKAKVALVSVHDKKPIVPVGH